MGISRGNSNFSKFPPKFPTKFPPKFCQGIHARTRRWCEGSRGAPTMPHTDARQMPWKDCHPTPEGSKKKEAEIQSSRTAPMSPASGEEMGRGCVRVAGPNSAALHPNTSTDVCCAMCLDQEDKEDMVEMACCKRRKKALVHLTPRSIQSHDFSIGENMGPPGVPGPVDPADLSPMQDTLQPCRLWNRAQ